MTDVVRNDANGIRNAPESVDLVGHFDPTIRLLIAGNRIALEVSPNASSPGPTTLEVGSLQRLVEILAHEPATAGELEAAISEIEEMLMPVIRLLPKRGRLVISAPETRDFLRLVGHRTNKDARVDIATVEEAFGRLAAVAYGTPASQLGLPERRTFAATVLVLRELMHHAGFVSVNLMR